MKDVTVSARIPEELNQQLTTTSQALRRDNSWIIKEAIRTYLPSAKRLLETIEEGIRADEVGDTVPHEEVMREVDALLAKYPGSK